jgi:hypothetical protein
MEGDSIKLFKLIRKNDVNKVSGTGTVALISVMPSGRAIMEWISSNHPTLTIFNNLDEITLIHGHGGNSIVVPLEEKKRKRRKT